MPEIYPQTEKSRKQKPATTTEPTVDQAARDAATARWEREHKVQHLDAWGAKLGIRVTLNALCDQDNSCLVRTAPDRALLIFFTKGDPTPAQTRALYASTVRSLRRAGMLPAERFFAWHDFHSAAAEKREAERAAREAEEKAAS
ncbi:hypothetical protein [Vulgatibacter sp.]|uniref:hypothetical protein n=1 Tax=Vulgatibacter sp. TaxID=1971226 RepID=UPI0035638EF1